jgi:DNA-nicking Smr family endonuclease
MAARARGLTEGDEADWARFAGRIAPLRGRPAVAPAEIATTSAPQVQARRPASAAIPVAARPAPLGVGGQPPGVDTATWQKFRRGRATRKLDLHGMTAQHAFVALRTFLRAAHADRVRSVEVVTGRGDGEGGGVLRRELPLWLNSPDIRPMVLAAVHPHISNAMHSHVANFGSVRLLLRRPRG